MKRRTLGLDGPEVSALGFGLMSLSGSYGKADPEESIDAVRAALDLGVTFFDTAEAYGAGHNEELAGRALRGHRQQVTIATKFGLQFADGRIQADGTPANVHRAVEGSLRRLGVDQIDLYYLHRRDPKVPIEETVGAMGRLVERGLVRWLGLSQISATTLRRAHATHPITAVQSEYSLWTREPEDEVLPACEELGVGFVPYSPLGRGFLTSATPDRASFDKHDIRRTTPYFADEHFAHNRQLAATLVALAEEHDTTAARLALAWLLGRSPHLVPIFGTRRRANVEENAGAASLELSEATLRQISQRLPRGAASGDSAPAVTAHLSDPEGR
jgi:aryl-alcohol dehydrogenase-like predicted oxidoreductase